MPLVELTHSNLKSSVYISTEHIAAVMHSNKDRCTHIISVGAIIPVDEPVDEVVRLVTGAAKSPAQKEEE